ncbi:MAG: mechanosensitive ion channel [Phycisphaeraceae bacterium]|nr:mechanosensitive ion channel [Phycisphaeraceae bacterium]
MNTTLAAIASAAQTFKEARTTALHTLRTVWEYEIIQVKGGAITVGMIVLGLILFVIGYVVARRISAAIAGRLRRRMGVTKGGVEAVQSLVFYTLLIIFSFFALNFAGVPLTAFTVLGGAMAIGVGFGSQNILNNFISGLILNIERPIKTGDIVEIDGTKGVVEHIGARSTRIITGANTHIIVPNSSFLEHNVLNWSFSNDIIRLAVNVGVAYGSPTREVERLLIQAANEHPKTLDDPAPLVRFNEFGESSLDFIVYAWLPVRAIIDLWQTQSDLRYRIDELFREHNITIAFPQRDVHVDFTGQVPAVLTGSAAS